MAKFLSFITLIPLDMLSTFKFPPLKILERSISCSWIMPSFDLDLSLTFSRKKLPSKTSTILLYTAFVIVVLPIPQGHGSPPFEYHLTQYLNALLFLLHENLLQLGI